MKLFKSLFGVALILLVFTAQAQQSQFATFTNWKDMLAQAKKENKLIFIDAYFVGCHPCKQMEDEVFVLPDVIKQMKENFVSLKIDFFKEDIGKELQVKYAVTGFPTFLIINGGGQLISMFSGYTEADEFQRLLSDAVNSSKKGMALKGFSPSLQVAHPDFYRAYFAERKSIGKDQLSEYLKGKDLLIEANALPLLVGREISDELSEQLLKNYPKLQALYGKRLVWPRVQAIMAARIKSSISDRDDAKFEKFLDEVKPLFLKEDWPYARLDMAEAYYYRQLKDHKAFFKYAVKHYNDDDNKVRYMAFYLHLPTVDEEEKKLYSEWMKLVVSKNSSYEVLGTAANMMKSQGDMDKARLYAGWGLEKARRLNKSSRHFEAILN